MRNPLRIVAAGALLLAFAVPTAHAAPGSAKAYSRTEVKHRSAVRKRTGLVGRVNLNTASTAQIAALPYVDAAEAREIVAARPIADPRDLVARGILTQQQYDKIRLRVTTSGSARVARGDDRWRNGNDQNGNRHDVDHTTPIVDRLNVNTATRAELDALPGVDDATAYRIISARPILDGRDLVTRGVITQDQFDLIHARISTSP